jgi:hypothetical protein
MADMTAQARAAWPNPWALTKKARRTYNPRSWLMRTIRVRPLGQDFSVITQELQMRSGAEQSWQRPVSAQGVFMSRRMVLTGAA